MREISSRMVYNYWEEVSEVLKKLLFVIICVVVLMALSRSGILKREPMSFDKIASQFKKDGFDVTDRQSTSFLRKGAVEGEMMKVGGLPVEAFRFANVGRLSIEYENLKPGPGDAMAQSIGITTQLGVQSRPVRGPQPYPAKKGLYLIVVNSRDKAAAKRIIDSFSRL